MNSTQSNKSLPFSECILLEHFENKGFGYVASQQIKSGTLVLSEKVKVLIQKKGKSTNELFFKIIHLLMTNKKSRIYFEQFCPHVIDSGCTDKNKMKKIVGDITNQTVKKFIESLSLDKVILLHAKIKRNIFECGDKLFVVFDGSKFNHSCESNVDYYFNEKTGDLNFYANKDIEEGSELFISYVQPNIVKSCITATYNFVCVCRDCELNKS